MWYASFKNTNLENTNLAYADLMKADLTKIKNKSLAGSDLSDASFMLADLSGINLSGVILYQTNLSGVKIGDTFSEKFKMSINKLLNNTKASGDLLTIYEKSFTGLCGTSPMPSLSRS